MLSKTVTSIALIAAAGGIEHPITHRRKRNLNFATGIAPMGQR